MPSRRSLLLGVARGVAFLPVAGGAAKAGHAGLDCMSCTSSSLTTHAFAGHMLVWSGALPPEYQAYFCLGENPAGVSGITAAVERRIAAYIALLSARSFLASALFHAGLRDEAERCGASADLKSAEAATFEGYWTAKLSDGDLLLRGSMHCAEICAHHVLSSLRAAGSAEDTFVSQSGQAAARALCTLHEYYREAELETEWVAHDALSALKTMLELEAQLSGRPSVHRSA